MTNLFSHVLSGMIENNEINDGSFSQWDSANHAIETYADSFDGETSDYEMAETVIAIQKIIDGADPQSVKSEFNELIWG